MGEDFADIGRAARFRKLARESGARAVTRADEKRLQLIRFNRWIERMQREHPTELFWIEIGLAVATACLSVLIARALP